MFRLFVFLKNGRPFDMVGKVLRKHHLVRGMFTASL